MQLASLRRTIAAISVAALAACAGQNSIPSQTASQFSAPSTQFSASAVRTPDITTNIPMLGGMSSDATSPCDFSSSFWVFGGSCSLFTPKAAGGKVNLAAFEGYSVVVTYPKSNAKKTYKLIVGDGTSDANITGTYQGKKFPTYGSKGFKCYNVETGKAEKCAGKGVVYFVLANASAAKTAVTFTGTPGLAVSGKTFPGAVCYLDEMLFAKSTYAPAGWGITPIKAAVSGGTVTLPSAPEQFTFPAGSILVLGMHCAAK